MVEAAEIEFGLALFTKPLKTQDVQQNQCFFAFSSRCNKKQQIPFRMIEKDGINSPQPPQFRLTTPLGFTRPVSKILAPVRKRVETAVPALRRWALVLARTPKWKLPTVVGPASCRSFSARCQKKSFRVAEASTRQARCLSHYRGQSQLRFSGLKQARGRARWQLVRISPPLQKIRSSIWRFEIAGLPEIILARFLLNGHGPQCLRLQNQLKTTHGNLE
jgi:hypothetical protein